MNNTIKLLLFNTLSLVQASGKLELTSGKAHYVKKSFDWRPANPKANVLNATQLACNQGEC